nr:esterase/lipase [uncultured bacterium]
MAKRENRKGLRHFPISVSGILVFLLMAVSGFGQGPLCIPVEYQTSPFFVHFRGAGNPTLVVIHGGFSSTLQADLFCCEFARILGQRYNIISVDYRFSSLGGGELVDVLRGINLAENRWRTPKSQIHLIGASHGGFLALMAASQEEVGSVIDAYGPTNWLIQWRYVREHRPDILKRWRIYLAISRSACRDMNLEFNQCLVQRSVVNPRHLQGLQEPILILHGAKDRLVPVKESKLLARELKKRGRKVTLVILPQRGHAFPLWKGKPLGLVERLLKEEEGR